jgi:hypothetical protein
MSAPLVVLAHLKAQLNGEQAPDLTTTLTQRLEAVFTAHIGDPVRRSVDTAITNAISNAIDRSMLTVLDGVLNNSIDSAISSAVTSLADRVSATATTDTAEDNPATLPMNVMTEEEPAILTMPDAAQVTTPVVEETVGALHSSPETATEATAEPTADQTPETTATANRAAAADHGRKRRGCGHCRNGHHRRPQQQHHRRRRGQR